MSKLIRKFFFSLLYLLPVVLFFSYHPVLKFGENSSMNFELSLPLTWLVLFDLAAFCALIALHFSSPRSARRPVCAKSCSHKPEKRPKSRKPFSALCYNFPGISDRRIFLLSLFPFFATLSIFWSSNPLRGALTAIVLWLVFFAIFALLYLLPLLNPPKLLSRRLLEIFFAASLFICAVCWLQSILDLIGFSRETTLLCLGCTYHSFGFPHPSGFAIEPQFMGNLLLAPTLLALYFLIFPPKASFFRRPFLIISACIFSATLFLTFSRGAIYAYIIALFAFFCFTFSSRFRPENAALRRAFFLIPAMTFIFTLCMQGVFSALGPTDETFLSGVTKSIHQLSLGRLDLRYLAAEPEEAAPEPPAPKTIKLPPSSEPAANCNPVEDGGTTAVDNSEDNAPAENSAIFEGYVAESTNARLDLNKSAFDTWLSAPGHPESSIEIGLRCLYFCCPCTASGKLTPTSVLFGVGLGGAGAAMYFNSFITRATSPKEIVQNQYFSLLLELGLVGIALVLLVGFILFRRRSPFWRSPALPYLFSLILAYLITLNFFSGFPNALHIYLLPPLFFIIFKKSPCNSKNSDI